MGRDERREADSPGVAGRVACAERLAICLEGGDVSEQRARELAEDDARRCAEGRPCACMEVGE